MGLMSKIYKELTQSQKDKQPDLKIGNNWMILFKEERYITGQQRYGKFSASLNTWRNTNQNHTMR